jgi:ribonuclease HII
MDLILGIDDAGRGPVIGPMVLAGCLMDKKTEAELKKDGVKDSKDITHKKREFLVEKIKSKVETFEIKIIPAKEIDSGNENGINLNKLEAIKAAEIINKINKGDKKIKIYIDCPSVSIQKWSDYLKTKISNLTNLEISCEHKADKNHVSVSAASILAKSTREKEVQKLKEIYGKEIGSGYCSDSVTMSFVSKHAIKYEKDGIFRKTWETWKVAFRKLTQKKL